MLKTEPVSAHAEDGFTLVEALCAIAILSLALVSLFDGLGGAQRTGERLDEMAAERAIAVSLMNDMRAHPRVSPVSYSGHWGAFVWSVTERPVIAAWASGGADDRWWPYTITFDVKGPRHTFHYSAIRLFAAR